MDGASARVGKFPYNRADNFRTFLCMNFERGWFIQSQQRHKFRGSPYCCLYLIAGTKFEEVIQHLLLFCTTVCRPTKRGTAGRDKSGIFCNKL